MKIALVSEHADPLAPFGGADTGGQNVHVAALAAGLAGRGHEVTVHTRRVRPGLLRRHAPGLPTADGHATTYAVDYVPMGPARPLPKDELLPHVASLAEGLHARWNRDRPDVVHSHFWMSGLAALGAAPVDLPVVHTFHALGSVKRREQGTADTSPSDRVALETLLAHDVSKVVATCTDEVRELVALGMSAERAVVVPCGVDVEHFAPSPLPSRRPAPMLLAVGRVVPRKGLDTVLQALAHVPRAELVVAGGAAPGVDDPDEEALRRLAARLGLADRVTFLGPVDHDHVPALMAACDAVVATPWYEPFGIVPLEAMACGRPVVGSGVGGLLDTVVPGQTGELVPPRRPDLLGACLRELLADRPRRERYGAAGRRRAVERYAWDRVVERTEQAYRTAVAEQRLEVAS